MSADRRTHVVLIPSYNSGARLFETVASARQRALPVIVVIDGSTDGTAEGIAAMAADDEELFCAVLPSNQGKGAAVLRGLKFARSRGFTHALTMDADGQHSVAHIDVMITASRARPDALVLGVPVFDASAPAVRVFGHKVSNFCTRVLTRRGAIADALFGFRVYPVVPLLEVFAETAGMRRFDFDSEAAIRLCWRGLRCINVATPVRYFDRVEGGVSHFRYLRDNLLLAAMYGRLLALRLTGWSMATRISPRADEMVVRSSRH